MKMLLPSIGGKTQENDGFTDKKARKRKKSEAFVNEIHVRDGL